jgi:hypothetical protein
MADADATSDLAVHDEPVDIKQTEQLVDNQQQQQQQPDVPSTTGTGDRDGTDDAPRPDNKEEQQGRLIDESQITSLTDTCKVDIKVPINNDVASIPSDGDQTPLQSSGSSGSEATGRSLPVALDALPPPVAVPSPSPSPLPTEQAAPETRDIYEAIQTQLRSGMYRAAVPTLLLSLTMQREILRVGNARY